LKNKRRRALKTGSSKAPAPTLGTLLVERIAKLYLIEKTIRGQTTAARVAVRQERSKPVVLDLKSWFEHQLAAPFGQVNYRGRDPLRLAFASLCSNARAFLAITKVQARGRVEICYCDR
jgi:hypothetical protein